MQYQIFSRDSNPDVDTPTFYASKDRLNMLLATGSVRMLTQRTAQYLTEMRDPLKRAAIAKKTYSDGGENGRQWRIVDQTPKGGTYPTAPSWQLVP